MRSVSEHVARAVDLVEPLPVHQVSVARAWGLVLGTDVHAAHDSPPFANSAMDGFAVRSADSAGASAVSPVRLTVVGESAAGTPSAAEVGGGGAIRIMTGAVVPTGADAVVPQEATREFAGGVEILAPAAPRAHIRGAGEDLTAGDLVVARGTRLAATHLAAIASTGHGTVSVRRAPVVAVLATGDELVAPGTALAPGQIADSNSVLIAGLVRQAGAEALVLPHVGDSPQEFLAVLKEVRADLIVTAGGVSVGAYDVVKEALTPLGVEFAAVAMQPGKPQGLGTLNGVPIACLPGNPVSVYVSFAVVVAAMIRALTGQSEPPPRTAIVAQPWRSPGGRQQYMPVRVLPDGRVQPAVNRGSQSHLVAGLASAQALAVIPAETVDVAEGDTVTVMEGT